MAMPLISAVGIQSMLEDGNSLSSMFQGLPPSSFSSLAVWKAGGSGTQSHMNDPQDGLSSEAAELVKVEMGVYYQACKRW